MKETKLVGTVVAFAASVVFLAGCTPPAANTALNSGATNSNRNTTNTNTITTTSSTTITTSEPEQYQANIKLTLETMGETQKASLPPVGAVVARSGADRVMEFALPTGEKVI